MKRRTFLSLMGAAALTSSMMLTGCGAGTGDDRKIVRIGHVQSQTHPDHLGLEAFANYINEKLGDKYRVEVYPSELLGSQTEMVQLTQTGAIDFVVASKPSWRPSAPNTRSSTCLTCSQRRSLPRGDGRPRGDGPHFQDHFQGRSGNGGVAGCRYPQLLHHQDPYQPALRPEGSEDPRTAVAHQRGNDASAGRHPTPMGFGDVYTALQAGILDGAENNELALTDNGHGDICKYYSYDMHQMVPDLLVANYAFLNELSDEERAIFEEGFQIVKRTEQDAWEDAVAEAKDKAENEQHVNFIYPDTAPFQEAMAPLHDSVLAANPELQPIYDLIQQHNAAHTAD